MMENLFKKRGKWCVRLPSGKLRKFNTEKEALAYLGVEEVEEQLDLWVYSENEDIG